MAIVQNPITGRSSGTYAGAVFATQFGKNVLRSKPVSVSVSQTDASKLAREKFSKLAVELKELMPALNAFFTSKELGMPVFSYMLKQAYPVAVSGTLGAVQIDRSKLLIGQDSLNLANGITVLTEEGKTTVTLSQPYIEDATGTENTLILAAYNETTGKLIGVHTDVSTNETGHTFDSPLISDGDVVAVWVKPTKIVKFKAGSELSAAVS